ncbi:MULTISPECIES: hypothetical protein [unclassified Variovorax]|jgi:hypothetical protein|uniref:hypothetical protein n=1 Tax=unclassified Variovorax TaxID=663243 RepID=UPI0008EC0ABE|nr:hypothetical protein [Variovorax sp. PDC80]SFO03204.1 hypothetical protein SAMN05443579_101357 [Variovorax sp. PDC80]
MKKLTYAFGAAALLSLAAISAPAQAQSGPFIQAQVYVTPAPPHRHYDRRYYAPPPPPHYHPGYHRGDRYYRHDRYDGRRYGRHDNDRDGVPNRYDRRPNNPYRY